MEKSSKAWSGVFTEKTDRRVECFTESITYDWRLYEQDIRGSIAHAQMLSECGLLTNNEFEQIKQGLNEIKDEFKNGKFDLRIELEDIHMHIESALIAKIGDIGRKLHTARSRNDQISTDLRLWVRDAIDRIDWLIKNVQRAFVSRCKKDSGVIMPGYTHMQRAQPVLAAHYWLAYCEKFQRDRERLADCRKRVNVCGLGSAALAGTSLPIDRHRTAKLLGFDSVAANSIDVSSDRDFVLESVYVLTQTALHMSNWAEEWIIWTTSEFNFIKCPQAFCTGSSIMPQKINPDVLELIRGKTARVVGDMQALFMLTKGLPLAYNRDLQEDKQRLFDAFDTLEAVLSIASPLIEGAELNVKAIEEKLERGYLDATVLMEHLIQKDVPQRTAHGIVGQLVRSATENNLTLSQLPIKAFKEACDVLDESVYNILGAKNSVAAMQSFGGTGFASVAEQLVKWRKL